MSHDHSEAFTVYFSTVYECVYNIIIWLDQINCVLYDEQRLGNGGTESETEMVSFKPILAKVSKNPQPVSQMSDKKTRKYLCVHGNQGQ